MREIYRDSDLVVRMVPQGRARRWIVTFESHMMDRPEGRRGFAEVFLATRGISAIHVLARGNHWYQYPGTPAALAAISAALADSRARRIVTYGSSMGAYAAVRFASAVRATGVLAMSPQYSINRDVVPEEQRWQDEARDIVWQDGLEDTIRSCTPTVVVFDPRDPDALQVARIAADTPIEAIPVRYAGHPSTAFLVQQRLVEPLLRSLLQKTFDPAEARRTVETALKGSPAYLAGLARHQPPHRIGLAVRLARKALEIAAPADHPLFQNELGKLLSRAGRHDEALEHLRASVEASRRHLGYVYPYGEALIAAGHLDAAVEIGREMVERAGDRSEAHALLGRALAAAGDHVGARACRARAGELNPAYREPPVIVRAARGPLRALAHTARRLLGRPDHGG
ncbi:alpha/beta hydrolase [Sphingomonas sp.]|uniref:alpha/beta hydrolase n=1 Tax=Sphingomonas sp. TaxID=28214 RepID=UPI0035C7C7B8